MVARAADEYLERVAAGESPDLDEFVRRYPQVAGVLPQVLPVLGLLKELAPAEPGPAALGEFRIVREIGRGGMGIVYEAEQVPLGRRVALKVLPAAVVADARPLARFQVEARVMAAMHHPHIVPIFAVGCDRGVHYYAMQLVAGCSLADRLRGTGGEPPAAARGGAAGDAGGRGARARAPPGRAASRHQAGQLARRAGRAPLGHRLRPGTVGGPRRPLGQRGRAGDPART